MPTRRRKVMFFLQDRFLSLRPYIPHKDVPKLAVPLTLRYLKLPYAYRKKSFLPKCVTLMQFLAAYIGPYVSWWNTARQGPGFICLFWASLYLSSENELIFSLQRRHCSFKSILIFSLNVSICLSHSLLTIPRSPINHLPPRGSSFLQESTNFTVKGPRVRFRFGGPFHLCWNFPAVPWLCRNQQDRAVGAGDRSQGC